MINDSQLFDFAPIGLVSSRDRVIMQCNRQFSEIFRASKEELTSQSLSIIYPDIESFERIGEAGLEVMKESARYNDERIMKRLNGEMFWCRVRGQALTPSEPFAEAIWSFSDISEERPLVLLSEREQEIALQICHGKTSKEIAKALDISYRTVDTHRARLLEKYSAKNTAELISRFIGVPL